MYQKQTINLITIVDETVTGEGVYVETAPEGQLPGESRARIFLNVTALTAGAAPTMDVIVTALVSGVDQLIVAFAQSAAGTSQQSVIVEGCPRSLKVKYTAGGTVADFDATVDIIRF